ncbi:SDR family oxidoreductase [Leptospira interrogans serovar Pomona]|uniref:SDR family oxidoreductase n=1 Tax=Leptospira interrogans serovar Pomona TaxID=44276 RepID=A0AA40W896_LEPIR|nr:oxidoreductase, short chain dehydrogenase/reductase family protein [Leptospira interrogans serovar Grippotyphosa str. Andaman]KYZ63960.1 3-ketoacyl-ACP reductase [Leptospira interrogans serovar Pomona]MBV6344042.1 SDR family oxidoreductase [Leptospira interrogans]MCD1184060.1 SDR family oxidoreductase [Leptospira sp. Pond_2020]OQN92008.1 3-ketoacyl-ACP reductase [Leptospira interrogans serovar Lai]
MTLKNQETTKKENIILTGGSGGLGRAIVKLLLSEGYSVTNLDIQSPKEIFSGEFFLNVDLTNEQDLTYTLSRWENLVSSQSQSPYGFVHCAGYGGPYHKITDVSLEEWDRIFSVNIRSAFQIVKLILPKFKKLQLGRLVFIASSLSIVGSANSVAYSASKHSLIGFVKSLSDEWGPFGITSNAVSPGYIETSMGIQEDQVPDHRNKIIQMTPMRKIASTYEIARVVSFLLNKESSYINGANWTVDGGITAI